MVRWLRRFAVTLGVLLVLALGVRACDSQLGPPLALWHTVVPPELTPAELDAADWPAWLAAEERAFAVVRAEVTDRLPDSDRVPVNRFFAGSPMYAPRFAPDWNRSFLLRPDGPPQGAAVFLHGLTDAPYSLRHVAERYRARGWVAVGLRLPGHGTVPAGIAEAQWEDWTAAVRLAVRAARAAVGEGAPLHLVGYSNGGALAVKHALDALEDPRIGRPDRLVLFSPMVGVTRLASLSWIAGLPAVLPRFAKSAWFDRPPEFNPFKYNSFPVNAAVQSWRLSSTLQSQVRRLAANGTLARMPPVLAFQSVVDATVSTPAVIDGLFVHLPANGSELVLFDLNRTAKLGPLVGAPTQAAVAALERPGARAWRQVLVTNATADSAATVTRVVEPGGATAEQPLGIDYPRELFSLSHVALPFPRADGLYGAEPAEDYGVRLGTVAARGERGVLVIGLDSLLRTSWNPFFPWVLDRIDGVIAAPR